MTSWEKIKKEWCEKLNIQMPELEVKTARVPVLRYAESQEIQRAPRRYNIHKRSLPAGIDRIVMMDFPSREDANRTIEKTTTRGGRRMFGTQLIENDTDDSKTCIFYEAVPVDASGIERSVYYNSQPLTTEPVEGF